MVFLGLLKLGIILSRVGSDGKTKRATLSDRPRFELVYGLNS
jgi:hypothetical protein